MRALALALAVVVAGATTAAADTVWYRVKANDSLGLIASEFYGDRARASYLMAENKLTKPRALRAGERLRVPVLREYVTAPGDTFQSLAEALLGDTRRGGFLADANRMSPDDDLPAGTTIVVPFTVTHVAAAAESLETVAQRFYGERRLAEVLRSYNQLDKATLDKGESIVVPSVKVRMHPARLVAATGAEAKARRERREISARLAAAAIPVARHAWRIGDYAAIKRALEPIDPAYVDLDAAVEIGVLLGSAHVAFDEPDQALAAFKRVLDRKPSHALRKFDHSPKVLAVWAKADGRIE